MNAMKGTLIEEDWVNNQEKFFDFFKHRDLLVYVEIRPSLHLNYPQGHDDIALSKFVKRKMSH